MLIAFDVHTAVREFDSAVRIDPRIADAMLHPAIARLALPWDLG
ncbi:MAG TPA: hypothetical protein VK939_05945 [Longimicrobiales bacterium]|nr:hypothetical protein [Longimicrobiales bacterium]